ncbi:MAG: DUF881 domain-containing protein [Bowdeniella nasicola]|nr:DUF881 domain-containing protein [Bowdeniella nasicola]
MSPTSWQSAAAANTSVSGGVLRKLLESPIDAGYSRAARERPYTPWHKALVLLSSIVLGITVVWAIQWLRVPSAGATHARASLEKRISAQTDLLDSHLRNNAALAEKIETLRTSSLPETSLQQDAQRQAGGAAGVFRVTGPGIEIKIDDTHIDNTEGKLQDFDFQLVINSLWAAGAEAIAVNGERIGPTTAVRTAGQAVQVNLKPLTPPYSINAIGDPAMLMAEFARQRGSAHLAGLREAYGVTVEIHTRDALELPPAPITVLRYIAPVDRDPTAVK